MAAKKEINGNFWWDEYVSELSPHNKLIYIYLLTCHNDITGIFQIPLKTIASDLDLDKQTVVEALAHFESAGKAFYRKGYVILKNWHKHTSYNLDNAKKYVVKYLKDIPQEITSEFPEIISNILNLAKSDVGQREISKKSDVGQRQKQTLANDDPKILGQRQILEKQTLVNSRVYSSSPSPSPSNSPSSSPSPSPLPERAPAAQKYIKGPDGHAMLNPEWKEEGGEEGRKEEEKKVSGKEGKEGKVKRTGDPNGNFVWIPVEDGGIVMKNHEYWQLEDEFGASDACDAIEAASIWAKDKNIPVVDPYKFVLGFAQNAKTKGRKGVASGQN